MCIRDSAQFKRIQTMIDAGIAEGAKLVAGGPGRPAHLPRGFFARPTVFSEVSPDMRIAREEIFGPVLSIQPYGDEEEAIALANDTVYGLGSCVQSRDLAHARRPGAHQLSRVEPLRGLRGLQAVGQRARVRRRRVRGIPRDEDGSR